MLFIFFFLRKISDLAERRAGRARAIKLGRDVHYVAITPDTFSGDPDDGRRGLGEITKQHTPEPLYRTAGLLGGFSATATTR